ncbi:hypothetical protein Tco_0732902 [Tanacetum coccineum]
MTPYTGYPNVQGIIYQDELSRKWLMRIDELHKFSDATLNHVRTTLNDIAIGIQIDYLPKRRWSTQDKRRARVMKSAIDKKLRDRRLMRSLEKFVGGRPVFRVAKGSNKIKAIKKFQKRKLSHALIETKSLPSSSLLPDPDLPFETIDFLLEEQGRSDVTLESYQLTYPLDFSVLNNSLRTDWSTKGPAQKGNAYWR